ncbi:MAG: hypothetical protein OEM03_06760 [Chromatiales bacterium]|nr:hypothetical protein [Chromatiales bacterium]
MIEINIRAVITDGIRYWEKMRIGYNAILLAIVLAVFAAHWPDSGSALSAEMIQGLFLLAVVANVFYCAAYIVDMVAQLSEFRKTWQRHRWILFAVGSTFASIIARFISMDMFGQVIQSAG